ncbi:MAG: ABC transporter ATP-binding protein [Deltaproteobacteria bacterium]|nr:ABC transporter ATP-binding protein [Deltaproteobacteria bacterium]
MDDLRVFFRSAQGEVPAVRGVSLELERGEAVALVGESGCGKSVTAASVLGLVGASATVSGVIRFEGRDVTRLPAPELRRLRGRDIGMVFQDPMTSLDPCFSVGYQLGEALVPARLPRGEVRRRCVELLADLGVPEPEVRLAAHPGQLSGGLRQRVMIAIATACRPKLLIADEPTTALDVTVQAQIMELLRRLRDERQMALLLITHDLGLVAHNASRVVVMYAGLAVEEAATRTLFADPLHPYTRGLLGSLPGARGHRRGQRLLAIPGAVPHPARVPAGCPFRDRCTLAVAACGDCVPNLDEKAPGHRVRCWRVVCST